MIIFVFLFLFLPVPKSVTTFLVVTRLKLMILLDCIYRSNTQVLNNSGALCVCMCSFFFTNSRIICVWFVYKLKLKVKVILHVVKTEKTILIRLRVSKHVIVIAYHFKFLLVWKKIVKCRTRWLLLRIYFRHSTAWIMLANPAVNDLLFKHKKKNAMTCFHV